MVWYVNTYINTIKNVFLLLFCFVCLVFFVVVFFIFLWDPQWERTDMSLWLAHHCQTVALYPPFWISAFYQNFIKPHKLDEKVIKTNARSPIGKIINFCKKSNFFSFKTEIILFLKRHCLVRPWLPCKHQIQWTLTTWNWFQINLLQQAASTLNQPRLCRVIRNVNKEQMLWIL